jgi:hypothetical protein
MQDAIKTNVRAGRRVAAGRLVPRAKACFQAGDHSAAMGKRVGIGACPGSFRYQMGRQRMGLPSSYNGRAPMPFTFFKGF